MKRIITLLFLSFVNIYGQSLDMVERITYPDFARKIGLSQSCKYKIYVWNGKIKNIVEDTTDEFRANNCVYFRESFDKLKTWNISPDGIYDLQIIFSLVGKKRGFRKILFWEKNRKNYFLFSGKYFLNVFIQEERPKYILSYGVPAH